MNNTYIAKTKGWNSKSIIMDANDTLLANFCPWPFLLRKRRDVELPDGIYNLVFSGDKCTIEKDGQALASASFSRGIHQVCGELVWEEKSLKFEPQHPVRGLARLFVTAKSSAISLKQDAETVGSILFPNHDQFFSKNRCVCQISLPEYYPIYVVTLLFAVCGERLFEYYRS